MADQPKKIELYEAILALNPKLERKGKTTGYTAINGNMFTFLSKEGEMGIRLPDELFEEFKKKFKAKQFKQYGANMQGYVQVPPSLMKEPKKLKKYIDASFEYAKTLKKK